MSACEAFDYQALNRASYDAIAAEWDAARVALWAREPIYVAEVERAAAEGGRLLDLGCGSGRPLAEHFIARGWQVTGVDQSETLLALARARHSAQRWIAE